MSELEHVDVRYVADLARIDLTDEEVELYSKELEDILHYVGQLDELDVADIEPTAHAAPRFNVMREDEPVPSFPREAMLANAPAVCEDIYVRVPAVIEEESNG